MVEANYAAKVEGTDVVIERETSKKAFTEEQASRMRKYASVAVKKSE